jgi:hypothetical protein
MILFIIVSWKLILFSINLTNLGFIIKPITIIDKPGKIHIVNILANPLMKKNIEKNQAKKFFIFNTLQLILIPYNINYII